MKTLECSCSLSPIEKKLRGSSHMTLVTGIKYKEVNLFGHLE